MTDKLPPNLLALFAPRPPLRYIPPSDRALDDIKPSHISGVAEFVPELKHYAEEVPYTPTESWLQRKARLKEEKKQAIEKHLTEGLANCMNSYVCRHILEIPCLDNTVLTGFADDPSSDPQVRGDPYRTLFVSRLSYDVKESDLEREFGRFGPIERV